MGGLCKEGCGTDGGGRQVWVKTDDRETWKGSWGGAAEHELASPLNKGSNKKNIVTVVTHTFRVTL